MMESIEKAKKEYKKKKILIATWGCEVADHYHLTEWIPFFKKFFGQTLIFSPRTHYFRFGKDEMNRLFIKNIEKERPDFLLLSMSYDEFYLDTLKKIKQVSPQTRIVHFFADDEWRYDDWSRFYAPYFDYNLVAELSLEHYKKDGLESPIYLHGSSSILYKPKKTKKEFDVTFIGMPIADRYDYVKYLLDNGIQIKVFGRGWEKYPELGSVYGGYLDNEAYNKTIHKSKINLSFSKGALPGSKGGQIKGRIFEYAASKEFCLVEYTERNPDFYKKNKDLVFKTKEELLKKVKFFLKNEKERSKLSNFAYLDFQKNHTWEGQFEKFFARIIKEKPKEFFPPSSKKSIIKIRAHDLNSPDLKEKIKKADYIYFQDEGWSSASDREQIQAYSLDKSKKEISCCDFYSHARELGDYMLFTAKKAFYNINKKDFQKLINLGNLMIRKKYFLKNLDKIRKNDFSFISDRNTAFVSIPLVRQITKTPKVNEEVIKEAFQMKFRDRLFSLTSQKKILFDNYIYKLFIYSLMQDKFILKYLIKEVSKKDTWYRIKNRL